MSVPAGSFPVRPTPNDGPRRSADPVWDESSRPTAPEPPSRTYSPREVASAQHLVDIHDHLRAELAQIQGLVRQVIEGEVDVGGARQHLNDMVLRSNRWTVGAHCAGYCYLLTAHHTLEDQAMLPGLRAVDPRLGPVLDRLGEEHLIIHEVLVRLDAALVDFVAERGSDPLLRAVNQLSDALLSHLSYEERELLEPLARAHLFG